MSDALTEYRPGLRRLLAPNPSPMTHTGTNTYLVGTDRITVIDPGPDDDAHLAAILGAAPRIEAILVTHSHLDHSALARRLSHATDAPVMAFGDSKAGRNPVMDRLAGDALGGGEGADTGFVPDMPVREDSDLPHGLTAHHTPGHFGNHLSFCLDDLCFSGDLVMGWSTTLISPPDGDLSAFYESCEVLASLDAKALLPGHGTAVEHPSDRIAELVAHRRARDAQIRAALAAGHRTAREIAAHVYTDLAPALLPAATRNVLAHLIEMERDGTAVFAGEIGPETAIAAQKSPA